MEENFRSLNVETGECDHQDFFVFFYAIVQKQVWQVIFMPAAGREK